MTRPRKCSCRLPVLDLDCPVHGEDVGKLVVKAIDEGRVISRTPDGRCELCGAVEETRPYGPNGEEVCHGCGTKDAAAVERSKRAFFKRVGG